MIEKLHLRQNFPECLHQLNVCFIEPYFIPVYDLQINYFLLFLLSHVTSNNRFKLQRKCLRVMI